jgi:hypothetical protein
MCCFDGHVVWWHRLRLRTDGTWDRISPGYRYIGW